MIPTLAELTTPASGTETIVVTQDGTRLRTCVAGEGPTVVLAHGYGLTASAWNVVASRLVAAGRRVISFDQRGHGASTIGTAGMTSAAMAADYAAVLDHHDVHAAVFIGHSMGGFLLLRFMLLDPNSALERLSHAILLAPFAGRIADRSAQTRLQVPLIRSGLMVALTGLGPIGRAFTKSLMGTGYSDACADVFVPEFRATRHATLLPILQAFVDEDYYPQLGEIAIPCTLMVGDRDKTTPAFHTEDMARLIPRAELVKIAGAGHLTNWEAADVIVERVVALG